MLLSFHVILDVKPKEDDTLTPASERVKRRHARPHELESDDEGKEEDNTLQDEEKISDNVEAIVQVDDDPEILVNWKTLF